MAFTQPGRQLACVERKGTWWTGFRRSGRTLIGGNYRPQTNSDKRPLKRDEPHPEPATRDCSHEVSPAARAESYRLVEDLAAFRVLNTLDRVLLLPIGCLRPFGRRQPNRSRSSVQCKARASPRPSFADRRVVRAPAEHYTDGCCLSLLTEQGPISHGSGRSAAIISLMDPEIDIRSPALSR